MNRANFGNVVTNGMQILSVGATTASGIREANRRLQQRAERQAKLTKPEYSQVDEIMQDSPQKQDIINDRNQKIDWKAKYDEDISKIQNALQPAYERFKQKEQEIGGNENANV